MALFSLRVFLLEGKQQIKAICDKSIPHLQL